MFLKLIALAILACSRAQTAQKVPGVNSAITFSCPTRPTIEVAYQNYCKFHFKLSMYRVFLYLHEDFS